MKRFKNTALLGIVLACVGCNQPNQPTANSATATASSGNSHEQDHDHGHDHSVEGHTHGAGPHDGTIVDWGGGKYHVEFTVDHGKQQATVYILGSDEKTPSPIAAESIELSIKQPELQVTLQASPQEGDPAGKVSRFIGTHEKLAVVQEYAGTLTGVIEGTPYSGNFTEHAHADHAH